MNINILIDNHLPVSITEYRLEGLNVDELREFLVEIKPKRLTAFAYGHDGWAQYPSKLNETPANMPCDLPLLWKDLASECGCEFGLYVSTLVNHKLLELRPDWERIGLDGIPTKRIDHASPYLSEWLKPVLEELQNRYEPEGYFFDGDYWTVGESLGPWRAEAAKMFFQEAGVAEISTLDARQQRQLTVATYDQYINELAAFLLPIAPKSSVNLAFTLRHPTTRPAGLNLVTSDLPPFFAAIDCWIETSVQHEEGSEREVVVPLFVEPEGGGRKYTKTLAQLVHEVSPILAMNESLHVYFPMDGTGKLRTSYASLLVRLRSEIAEVAPCLAGDDYVFEPDVYCLSDSATLLYSQDFSELRGAAIAASVAGMNMCVASTDLCIKGLERMRLLIAPMELSLPAQACVDAAKQMGISVLQKDFGPQNYIITQDLVDELNALYELGPRTEWSDFKIERPKSAFVRALKSKNNEWRLFVFNATEVGNSLGRHVMSGGAGYAGVFTLLCPSRAKIRLVEGYINTISHSDHSVSFELLGAFAIIEGDFEI